MSEFRFSGVAANNLLGFMAALGTLRTATLAWPESRARMYWNTTEGVWTPQLILAIEISHESLIAGLHLQLQKSRGLEAFALGDDLKLPVADYRDALVHAQKNALPQLRCNIDFLAALGSDVVQSRLNGKPTGQIADTAFRTMSGAGHQHFLGTIRTFITDTTETHLDKALFQAWLYDDPLEKHSLRWDPIDDIRYALRWDNPSGDRERKTGGSMWGAYRLAIEALPLFPAQPVGDRLETTGFVKDKGKPLQLTWPVWNAAIGLYEVLSLLSSQALVAEVPDRSQLTARGVVDVFRCERITRDKYRNFTTAWPV